MIFKKIRKGYADWRNFLCSTPARDYVFQKDAYEDCRITIHVLQLNN